MTIIVHLVNKGPRGPMVITQGLMSMNINLRLDVDYYSLGKKYKKADKDICYWMSKAKYIFAGDDNDKTISKKYGKIINKNNWWNKVIWYDYRDYCNIDYAILHKALVYFKRSLVTPERMYIKNLERVYPLDYAALNEYFINNRCIRDIDIGCYFDIKRKLGKRRDQLVETMLEEGVELHHTETGTNARKAIAFTPTHNPFVDYLKLLSRSKIIFTAFPENHDGDSRTWEAFASGALVFRDKTFIKHKNQLINGKHFMEYDADNKMSIKNSIKMAKTLIVNKEKREEIAKCGFEYVLKYHKPINRVEEMLSYASKKQLNIPFI